MLVVFYVIACFILIFILHHEVYDLLPRQSKAMLLLYSVVLPK